MDDENAKPWERPWTADEIRANSDNWNLAGDAGLLNHLQQFSQNLLAKTHSTEVALDELMEDLKTTSTSVQNVMNTFLFLANTQFVENRVYDDDENETPPDEKKEDIKVAKSKEEQEAEVFQRVKQALDGGLSLLDTHFEAVEVPASEEDSEEEGSASVGRLVLKPKNPYLSRPLPYLIGSQEFMEDDRVGLGDISSDTEESPDQNIVQSSGSDDEMENDELVTAPKRPMVVSSDTENSEPESDRSESVAKQRRLRSDSATGAFGAPVEQDMFGQESPPEADEATVVKGGLKSAFSDELASKLSAVETQNFPKREKAKDNMFVPSSEPEDDSGLFGKDIPPFSEKHGLFDDLNKWQNTSDSLWENNTSPVKPSVPTVKEHQNADVASTEKLFGSATLTDDFVDDEQDGIFSGSKATHGTSTNVSGDQKMPTKSSQGSSAPVDKTGLLFNQNDDSGGLLFGKTHKDDLTASSGAGLFDKSDLEEDDLFNTLSSNADLHRRTLEESKKKKLPGAVPVLKNVDLFGSVSSVARRSSTTKNESSPPADGQETYSNVRAITGTSGRDAANNSQEGKNTGAKSFSIESESDSLFQNAPASTKLPERQSSKSLLFKEENDNDSLFDKPYNQEQGTTKKGAKASASANLKVKSKKPVSLFDDSDSADEEMLFSSTSSTSSRSRRSQGSGDVLANTVERKTISKKGIFDSGSLFGGSVKDDPDIDIFSSQSETKMKSTVPKDNFFAAGDVFSGSSISNRKTASNIFDDIDDVDDIFAVPKVTMSSTEEHVRKGLEINSGKVSLFDDNVGNTSDIFSKKTQEYKHEDEPRHPKEEKTDVVKGLEKHSTSPNSGDIAAVPSRSTQSKEREPTVTAEKNIETMKETKPTVSQKPKVPTKPPSSSVSSQESSKSFPASKPKNVDTSHVTKKRVSEEKKSVNTSVHEIQSTAETGRDGKNQVSSNISASVTHSVKPEPPRTLNIRKTTDTLGSPSNDDDDLFESSLNKKSVVTGENLRPRQAEHNVLRSSSYPKLLDGFASSADIRNQTPVCQMPKIGRSPSPAVGGINHADASDLSSSKATGSSEKSSSPSKLLIDPTALLPGAKPPSARTASDRAVGFDKPAEPTSTLHSAGKERVKIQVKRRPQTRRARQEALRASSVEYDTIDAALISHISNCKNNNTLSTAVSPQASSPPLNSVAPSVDAKDPREASPPEKSESIASGKSLQSNLLLPSKIEPNPQKTNTSKNFLSDCLSGSSNPLSPVTDEEDLFAVPHELPFDEVSSKDISDGSKNLFGGAPVLSPLGLSSQTQDFNDVPAFESYKGKDDFSSGSEHSVKPVVQEDSASSIDRLNEKTLASSITTTYPDSESKTDGGSISSVSSRDLFTKESDRKWLDRSAANSIQSKGLFDSADLDIDSFDKEENDGDDADLFSSIKKQPKPRTKLAKQNAFSVISPDGPPLFSSDNSSQRMEEHVHGKSSSSKSAATQLFGSEDSAVASDVFSASKNTVEASGLVCDSESVVSSSKAKDFSQQNESDSLFSHGVGASNTKSHPQTEKVKTNLDTLFNDDSVESDDLFGFSFKVPKKSVAGPSANSASGLKAKAKESLFDEGDDDDDIFTLGLNKSRETKSDIFCAKDESSSQHTERDTDLFLKKNGSGNQGTKSSLVQKAQPAKESFEDPLMVFQK